MSRKPTRRGIDGGDTSEGEQSDSQGNSDDEGSAKDKIGAAEQVRRFGGDAGRVTYTGGGRRSRATINRRGHYVRSSIPTHKIRAFSDIALDATIRAAAINQTNQTNREQNDMLVNILPRDYRVKIRESKVGNLILFVVDGSGSMAARKRMGAVKGAIMSLLLDAYQKRDHVGLITFRHRQATLVLPPTNSTDLAQKYLAQLPTGGRTPLSHAMLMTYETLRKYRTDELIPLVILISDCRGNVLMGSKKQLLKPATYLGETLIICDAIAKMPDVSSLVIDCEIGRGRWYFAPKVADALDGLCVRIEAISADKLTKLTRTISSLA